MVMLSVQERKKKRKRGLMVLPNLRTRAATTVAAAGIVLGGTVALAAPANAGTPPYRADCSGRYGDVGAHRLVRYNHTAMRHLNAVKAKVFTRLAKGKRLHLFYETTDNRAGSHLMWASRAYVGGEFVCGYVYSSAIDWSSTW